MELILLECGDAALTQQQGNDATGGGRLALVDNPGSVDFDVNKCIELVSINHGIKQQITSEVANSAPVPGHPILSDFSCVKYVDVNSSKLYEYCLLGKRLDSEESPCRIHVLRNSGEWLNVLIRFELTNVVISEIAFQSNPDDMATEKFKLKFSGISWVTFLPGSDLRSTRQFVTGWDVARNQPIETGS